jgi:hypothetical protein
MYRIKIYKFYCINHFGWKVTLSWNRNKSNNKWHSCDLYLAFASYTQEDLHQSPDSSSSYLMNSNKRNVLKLNGNNHELSGLV